MTGQSTYTRTPEGVIVTTWQGNTARVEVVRPFLWTLRHILTREHTRKSAELFGNSQNREKRMVKR